MSAAVISPDDFLPEQAVIDRWPIIKPSALRGARRRGDIDYYQFPAGVHYTAQQVQAWLDRSFLRRARPTDAAPTATPPMTESDGSSADTISTSPIATVAEAGTPAGMRALPPDLALSVAEASAQRILAKQSGGSSRLSPKPPRRQTKRLIHATS